MSLQDLEIIYKEIDKELIGYINFRGEIEDIPSKIEELYQYYKEFLLSPPFAIIDYGVYSEGGKDIDLCFPIKESIELDNINTKYLDEVEVLSKIHNGQIENIDESFQQLNTYFKLHGLPTTEWLRLVFHHYDRNFPDNNEIEIQKGIHPWDKRLTSSLDRVLGEKARRKILKDREKLFTIESSNEERTGWVKSVIERIDQKAKEYEKYDILSPCAHKFSRKRIESLKSIYKETGDLNEVLKEMHKDYEWYEDPVLKDNIIYVTKIPYNPEGYKKAHTLKEKQANYCHCPLVRNHFNEGISPTFCNCSAGWYRQLWEGIIGRPINIKILKSLLKGDQNCKFAIYLPTLSS
ncbi:MAG: hypothetical protein ACFFFT_12435 [Candidatus Thorarchaeota archaeon]